MKCKKKECLEQIRAYSVSPLMRFGVRLKKSRNKIRIRIKYLAIVNVMTYFSLLIGRFCGRATFVLAESCNHLTCVAGP